MALLSFVGGIACGVVAGWAGVRMSSSSVTAEVTARQALDDWVDGSVANFVARRSGLPVEVVRTALREGDDARVHREVDAHLDSALLRLTRQPGGAEVEAQVTLNGRREGSVLRATRTVSWDDLPAEVRGRFLRDGDPVIELPWRPRWQVAS